MRTEALLEKLVSINSVFPNEGKMTSFLEKRLKQLNFKVKRQQVEGNRYNLLAERGTGRKSILFFGHMDTVPPSTLWKNNPFKVIKNDDKLFGLGCFDMKGGIAALLSAFEHQNNRKIKLLLCVDEENVSRGAWKAVRQRKNWFSDVELAISADSGERHENGANVVTLGSSGRIVFTVDVKGRSSHQAGSHKGINALVESTKIINSLSNFKLLQHSRLGNEELFIREIHGESKGLSLPEDAHFEIDMRTIPNSTSEKTIKRLETFIEKLKKQNIINNELNVSIQIKQRDTPYLQPYITDINNQKVKKVLNIIRRNSGKPILRYGGAVSDENVIANATRIPVIRMCANGSNSHSANEWVSRKSLKELTSIYGKIIEQA